MTTILSRITPHLQFDWRGWWKRNTTHVAMVIVALGAARDWAQDKVAAGDAAYQWLAHAPWYVPATMLLGVLVPIARARVQSNDEGTVPVADPPASTDPQPAAVAATTTEGIPNMSPAWEEAIQAMKMFATMAEVDAPAAPGAQKAAAVTNAVLQTVPAFQAIHNAPGGAAKTASVLAGVVAFLNALSPIFAKPVVPQGGTVVNAMQQGGAGMQQQGPTFGS